MVIGVCGFGSTGSGAVVDYLREFSAEVSAGKNMEMSFLYEPDGILDLEYNLIKQPIKFYNGDAALKKFYKLVHSYDLKRYTKKYMSYKSFIDICDEYINDLIETKWTGGLWAFDRRQVSAMGYFLKYFLGHKYLRIFDKFHIEQPQHFLGHKMYVPIHDERFYIATKKFTQRLLDLQCDHSKKYIVLDQPFPANNPSLCFHFFNDKCKAIIVNRDPRDLYIVSKKNQCGWELRFTPTYSVRDFVVYYRDLMHTRADRQENVLNIRFEDLIYKYDESTKTINEFLDLHNHLEPRRRFNPSVSIANTQMILRYPELQKDIEFIEKELKDYLYPFDESRADLSLKPWNFVEEV